MIFALQSFSKFAYHRMYAKTVAQNQGAPKAREAKRPVSLMSRCVMHMQTRLRSSSRQALPAQKFWKFFTRRKSQLCGRKSGVSLT